MGRGYERVELSDLPSSEKTDSVAELNECTPSQKHDPEDTAVQCADSSLLLSPLDPRDNHNRANDNDGGAGRPPDWWCSQKCMLVTAAFVLASLLAFVGLRGSGGGGDGGGESGDIGGAGIQLDIDVRAYASFGTKRTGVSAPSFFASRANSALQSSFSAWSPISCCCSF